MSRMSDLVKDAKLRTKFDSKHTIHYHLDSDEHERTVLTEVRWKRHKHIGEGAHGRVWLEKRVQGHRGPNVRAVKRIPKLGQQSKPINYNRELEAIEKFSHKQYERRFVKSFGWFESQRHVFIAMEYFPHGDLYAHLSSRHPLPESEAKDITFQILEAVWYMHDNGFAHRDLKPGNILIKSKPPENWCVKVGDFGISKRVEDLCAPSTVKGTPGFIAPELYGFVQPSDRSNAANPQAADMWSLGELAYQMLTKEPTFKDIYCLSVYIQNPRKFPSATLRNHGVSDEGINFIESLMTPVSSTRLTAKEAVLHPWIRSQSEHLISAETLSQHVPQDHPVPFRMKEGAELLGRWTTTSIPAAQLSFLTGNSSLATEGVGKDQVTVPQLRALKISPIEEKNVDRTSLTPITKVVRSTIASLSTPNRQGQESMGHELSGAASQPIRTLIGHLDRVHGVAFSLDGRMIASCSNDRTVRLWDSAGKLIRKLEGNTGWASDVAFSPDSRVIASCPEGDVITLWNVATGKVISTLFGHSDRICGVAFSPDGRMIASCSRDQTIMLWLAGTGSQPTCKLEGHSDIVNGVAFSPDGRMIASCSDDQTIRLWDAANTKGQLIRKLEGHSGSVLGVAFSPDERIVASCSFDTTIGLWDASTGQLVAKLEGHSASVWGVAFSPNGRVIASCSYDKTVRLWDTSTCRPIRKLEGHSKWVRSVAFSPNGRMIASCSIDETVMLWDVTADGGMREG